MPETTPTPEGGERVLTVDSAAQELVGILDAEQPPKSRQEATTNEDQPTQQDGEIEEGEQGATDETGQEEDAGISIETLEQLAENTGLKVEDILNLKARTKVDGNESDVPLSEVLKSYQLTAHVNNQSQELANQRKAFEAERERIANDLTARFTQAEQMTGFLEQTLMGEYNSINWNELRAQNPAEYAALQQDYNSRYNQIQQLKANVANQLQAQQAELVARQEQDLSNLLTQESQKLMEKIPEFRDEVKAKELKGQLRDYLKSHGYSEQEIAGVHDHRQVMIIRDAMAYRAMQSKKPELTKKVVNLPKVQKPGAAKSKADIRNERVNQKMSKLRKSGNTQDLAEVLKEII